MTITLNANPDTGRKADWLSEEQLKAVVYEATLAALGILDKAFPGKNKGGVGDGVAFAIDALLMEKLKPFVGDKPAVTITY